WRARGKSEDDAKNVVRVAQVAGQIEDVGYVRPAELADLLAVQEDPTGIIQPEAAQPRYLFGLYPGVRHPRLVDPVPVLDPLTGARIQPGVPVRQQSGGPERSLHRPGN